MAEVHPIESLLATAMQSIKSMVDVNTILGEAVQTPNGTVILPVSRVSFGFAAGGREYPGEGSNLYQGVDRIQLKDQQERYGKEQGRREATPDPAAQAQDWQEDQGYAAALEEQGYPDAQDFEQMQDDYDPYQAPEATQGGQSWGQQRQPPNPGAGYGQTRSQGFPFAGGSGAGISLSPVGFLVVQHDEVRLVSVHDRHAIYDRLIDLIPRLMEMLTTRRLATSPSPAAPAPGSPGPIGTAVNPAAAAVGTANMGADASATVDGPFAAGTAPAGYGVMPGGPLSPLD